jgi:hypothetical protein
MSYSRVPGVDSDRLPSGNTYHRGDGMARGLGHSRDELRRETTPASSFIEAILRRMNPGMKHDLRIHHRPT